MQSSSLAQQRILIIKQSSLGDIAHTLPLIHALKRCAPSCYIGWVAEHAFTPLLHADRCIDTVYPIHIPSTSEPGSSWQSYVRAATATFRVLRQLRRHFTTTPYDLTLDLHASWRSALIGRMNPGGRRIGFAAARELNSLFQHERIAATVSTQHAVDHNLLFAEYLHCPVLPEDFFLALDREAETEVALFLQQQGVEPAKPLIYAQPAARWQSKQWVASRWAELCDRLLAEGVQVVLGGTADELPYLSAITQAMRRQPIVAAGQLSLNGSAALLGKANLYLGVDSGPMHLAALAGTPVVAIFGPTHPERVGPYGVRSRIVRAEGLSCLCCRQRACSHQRCMEGISVDQVYEAVLSLLAEEKNSLPKKAGMTS